MRVAIRRGKASCLLCCGANVRRGWGIYRLLSRQADPFDWIFPASLLVRGPADDRGPGPFKKGVLSVHGLVQSLVGNKDLVRFLNVRMNGIGPALQQWGMGSAKVLAQHSAAWAELLSWRSLAPLKTRWRKVMTSRRDFDGISHQRQFDIATGLIVIGPGQGVIGAGCTTKVL